MINRLWLALTRKALMRRVPSWKWPSFCGRSMSSVKSHAGTSSGSRSARRRSREFALQGLYQWLLTGTPVETIELQLSDAAGFNKIDLAYFHIILSGAISSQANL